MFQGLVVKERPQFSRSLFRYLVTKETLFNILETFEFSFQVGSSFTKLQQFKITIKFLTANVRFWLEKFHLPRWKIIIIIKS